MPVGNLTASPRSPPGTPALRALLGHGTRPALTRSKVERRFLDLIRQAGLPAPEVNFTTEHYELIAQALTRRAP
jgi:hypothetical protein